MRLIRFRQFNAASPSSSDVEVARTGHRSSGRFQRARPEGALRELRCSLFLLVSSA